MFRAFTICAALMAAIPTVQAGAITVNLKGVDLSDSQALALRIIPAAEVACGPAASPLDNRPSVQAEASLDHQACVRRASEQAMAVVEQARIRLAKAQGQSRLASK